MTKRSSLFFTIILFAANCSFADIGQYDSIFPDNNEHESALTARLVKKITQTIGNIKKHFYKPVTSHALVEDAISGLLANLDPHSEYLNKRNYQDLKMLVRGTLGGIGVEMIPSFGALKVIAPVDGTPASRAGIKPGDLIVQLNNKAVSDLTLTEATNIMRGKIGESVRLKIVRKNTEKPLVFNLRRENIDKTVKAKMLEPGYGYIRLIEFYDNTEREFVEAFNNLEKLAKKTGFKGLVLDLRNNPGGSVLSAVDIADDFLNADRMKNKLIVYAKGKNDIELMSKEVTPGDLIPDLPLVILINEGTASAAEIVVGALQDHKRAIIVGTQSFGKGSMQSVIPIDNDTAAIKLTTALYYTPLGRSIQGRGIEPDIYIEELNTFSDKSKLEYADQQLYEALHILKVL